MKKTIAIYLIGVIVGWFASMNLISDRNEEEGRVTTYGDVAFVTCTSLFSWAQVAAVVIVEVTEMDVWDKPI